MKKVLIMVLSFLLINQILAQCIADAGPDKVVCNYPQGFPIVTLGSNPTAISGTPPYTYTWETTYMDSIGQFSVTYHASDFLYDTTLANPTFSFITGDSLNFILTVTDVNNNVCKDTVFIRASHFIMHLATVGFTIQQGDSVYIDVGTNIWSSNLPYSVLWQPTHGLSDSTSQAFWSKPDTSVAYSVTITDALGCFANGGAFIYVTVVPLGIAETSKTVDFKIYPNPFSDKINIKNLSDNNLELSLYNSAGKLILSKNIDDGISILTLDQLSPGFYFCMLKDNNTTIRTHNLIKY